MEDMKIKQIDIFKFLTKPKKVVDEELPEGIKLNQKQSWCPYCSMPVVFVREKKRNIKCCPICGISDKDYYVKRVNKN